MIWGTGAYYRIALRPWVTGGGASHVRFLGFIDVNRGLWGERCDGHTVHPPEVLLEREVDFILIATSFRAEVIRKVERMGVTGARLI